MKINHKKLVDLLQKAYSAEKAAAFAYIGHHGSLRSKEEREAIKAIENDEWFHRKEVHEIMKQYDIPVSKFYEFQFYVIGKFIAVSCYIIGWFMPFYFAGRLESGNVCEYFVMMHYFHELGIRDHDKVLYNMGLKEKEHEEYFLSKIQSSRLLPIFEKVFKWGKERSYNDIEIKALKAVEESNAYCKNIKKK
ncbi:MAG: hypothetical protein KDD32_04090 [Bacteroidetes bacterium]|nr:hypothetical protein [Bacteroidota bacterium]